MTKRNAYVIIYLYIMKNTPNFEHPFYDIPGPIAVAHRGGDAAGREKENSMAAFESAQQAGFIYGETDTIATKDGVPLAFHGSRTEKIARETGLPLRDEVQNLTLAEVKELYRIGGEAIPTLEEVLTTFPDMRFFIDPKTEEVVKPLGQLIARLHVQDRVSVAAFSYERTKAVSAELPNSQRDLCTGLAVMGSMALVGLGLRLTEPISREYFKHTKANALQVPHYLVTPNIIEKAHDLGIHVVVWPKDKTYDTTDYMHDALDRGVDGLMSDHTNLLKYILLSRDPDNESIKH